MIHHCKWCDRPIGETRLGTALTALHYVVDGGWCCSWHCFTKAKSAYDDGGQLRLTLEFTPKAVNPPQPKRASRRSPTRKKKPTKRRK